jgi:hypothetical protein
VQATYSAVSGSFVVPVPSLPPGSNSGTDYSSAVWVGIDGVQCGGLLQTGINVDISGTGQVSYARK